jgi:hypothetical protein
MQRILPIAVASMLCGCIIQGERPADSNPRPRPPPPGRRRRQQWPRPSHRDPVATTASDGTSSPRPERARDSKAPAAPWRLFNKG